ncbi:unnamed protein product [Ophioblennius macclurei]
MSMDLCLPALSEAPPSPPQNVHVDQGQLTWSPASGEEDVNFTVLSVSLKRPTNKDEWEVVAACNHTSLHFCNITLIKAQAKHGCIKLRVQAQRHGLTSIPVQACSIHGDSCTPRVSLTARPGSLTVHLTEDNSLFYEHAAHASHDIYFGKEGEPLLRLTNSASSWTMDNLEVGQRYCAKVEYVIFNKSVGLSSCVQCELIPKQDSSHSVMVTGVIVGVIFFLVVIPVISYVLLCQREQIKRWLQPPYEIPEHILEPQLGACVSIYSPTDEHCDKASLIILAEEAQQ